MGSGLTYGHLLLEKKGHPMIYKAEEYLREDGTSPYEEWFMGLDTAV
jgi:hypothetical protein